MAITDRPAPKQPAASSPAVAEPFAVPYLGRTVRIVGPVQNVDPHTLPHQANSRGELGRAVFNWRHNTVANEPLGRMGFEDHCADRNHILTNVVRRAAKSAVNPNCTPVTDPAAMTRHIKRVARHLGFDVVGVGRSHPAYAFAGRAINPDTGEALDMVDGPEILARRLPFMVFASVAWDYNMTKAHRHRIGDAAYDFTQQRTALLLHTLEGYIRELGYQTLRGAVQGQAAAVAAGVGELGRNGLVITPKYGARIHAGDAIMTDLPLVADEPIDIGVDDFCKVCKKCAITCPTNSISFDDKVVHNGIEKYKINWETCYRLRPLMLPNNSKCLTCVTSCPYTKPTAWWHDLAIATLRHCPKPARPLLARGLKWLDDRVWGTVPNKRVQWLHLDSGVRPGEKACTIPGCAAQHESGVAAAAATGNVGYYPPLKENTNRFVKRG